MKNLDVLLLVDNKPGHYHLSEGVITALERLTKVRVRRIEVRRRRWMTGWLLAQMVAAKVSPQTVLGWAYGLKATSLPESDLVISAGGNALAANIAASRVLKADNVFIGSIRRFKPEDFSLVITSYQKYADLPRHLAIIKPSPIDPDQLGRTDILPRFDLKNPPKQAGLLLGGNTPDHKFKHDDWQSILNFVEHSHASWGIRWLVSNSRRTPNAASDLFTAARSPAIKQIIDIRQQQPGTLSDIFRSTEFILCTDDSSSMISEAISARLPVVAITPEINSHTDNENQYRLFLQSRNWTRTLAISELDENSLAMALSEINPMQENHIAVLAEKLKTRLPDLLA